MNILESLLHDIQKPPGPPHLGESFFLWTYFLAAGEARALLLILANHTNDQELKETIEHLVDDVLEPQLAEVKKLLIDEGITLPVISADPPKANHEAIPAGAKVPDEMLARMLMVKVHGLIEIAFQGLRFSYRSDLGSLFFRFLSQIVTQGYTLREMMLKRGWLPVPPPHLSPPQ